MNARIAKNTLAGKRIGRFGRGWTAWQSANKMRAAAVVAERPKWHPPESWNPDRPDWLREYRKTQATRRNPYPVCSNCHHGRGPTCAIRGGPCPAFPKQKA